MASGMAEWRPRRYRGVNDDRFHRDRRFERCHSCRRHGQRYDRQVWKRCCIGGNEPARGRPCRGRCHGRSLAVGGFVDRRTAWPRQENRANPEPWTSTARIDRLPALLAGSFNGYSLSSEDLASLEAISSEEETVERREHVICEGADPSAGFLLISNIL